MVERHPIRWTIFAGIIFTVVGMCLLNYYSLFPEADKTDAKKYDIGNNGDDNDDARYIIYKNA